MTAIVLGNGPSRVKGLEVRKEIPLTKVYACNLFATVDKPDYLYAIDPWVQFDIVRSEYRGVCRFRDFDPIPVVKQYDPRELYGAERYAAFEALMLKPEGVDKQIKDVIYSTFPEDFDIKIHNPEHKADAIGWIYYHTGATMHPYWAEIQSHRSDDIRYDKDYWRPHRAYILYVPAGLNITMLEGIEDEKDNIVQRAPTGAYALQGAIDDGHTEISVYGFDSIVGEYATKSRIQSYEVKEEIRRGKHFIMYYDKIMDTNPEVNITWCT